MTARTLLFVASISAMATSSTSGRSAAVGSESDPGLLADLDAVSERRVFFAHRSVGGNILDGLRQLAAGRQSALRIVEATPAGVPPRTVAHAAAGPNGNPHQKLRSFEEAFASGIARGAEIALVKFCYVDIGADTDVQAVFSEYQATIARLRGRHPGTTFVHVTAPLTTLPSGFVARVRRAMGRPDWMLLENARREDYNSMLRRAYGGSEPIFDLARVESTRVDGTIESADLGGRAVPVLLPELSDDGGHLNQLGQRRAARELTAVLASVHRDAPRRGPR